MDLTTIPFERSTDIPGLTFTGRHQNYTNGYTIYPTWACDGHLCWRLP